MFLFGRMADVTELPQSAFWPTLTYFCDCDTQLYDRSKIVHISKAITAVFYPSYHGTLTACLCVSPLNPSTLNCKIWPQKLEMSLCCVVHSIFRYIEPFIRVCRQCGGQMVWMDRIVIAIACI